MAAAAVCKLEDLQLLYNSQLLGKRFKGKYLGVHEVVPKGTLLDVILVDRREDISENFRRILKTVEKFECSVWTGIIERYDEDFGVYTRLRISGLQEQETYEFLIENVHIIECMRSVNYDFGANIQLGLVSKIGFNTTEEYSWVGYVNMEQRNFTDMFFPG